MGLGPIPNKIIINNYLFKWFNLNFYLKRKNVSFTANEKPACCMCVKEDMMFAELATKFCENYGLKEDNKPTFYFNS